MPFGAFKTAIEKTLENFELEPSEPTGDIPESVIAELRGARAVAKDYAQGYSDAVKAQAEKYKLKAGALKRYIAALEDDKLQELDEEMTDLEKLIGSPE
jgi:hypothetical protein